jgi:hypothetical protein
VPRFTTPIASRRQRADHATALCAPTCLLWTWSPCGRVLGRLA